MGEYATLTADPAVEQMLEIAHEKGIETAFDRAERIKPCPIGSDGVCCKVCSMGPCRLVGKVKTGICGATVETVVARNLARQIAAGAAQRGHRYLVAGIGPAPIVLPGGGSHRRAFRYLRLPRFRALQRRTSGSDGEFAE